MKTSINLKFRQLTESLGDSVIPKKYRSHLITLLQNANIKSIPYYRYGKWVYLTFITAIVLDVLLLRIRFFMNLDLLMRTVVSLLIIPITFSILLTILIVIYVIYLRSIIQKKVHRMEEVFPEFLGELSLNLKAGQGLIEALSNSTEESFGDLTQEIREICKRVELGVEVETSIKEFTNAYNSEVIGETFELILMGWRKGTQLTKIVDRVLDNLELMRHLRKKIVASVANYRIFLSFVNLIIAPALFALTYYVIDLLRSITDKILGFSVDIIFPISLNAVRINDQHFQWFSILALILISTCTGVIISVIKSGNIEEGYKEIALFSILSILIYKIFMVVFANFFTFFVV